MTTPTIFASTDASAPVLTGTVGSMIALLVACLKTGYGSKSAAGGGWGEPYTGTNLAVFQAPAGERLYLAIDDSNAQYAKLNGYEVMTAVQTGTGLFPTAVQLASDFVIKSSTADSTARPWIVMADDRAVWVFVFAAQTVYGITATTDSGFFFGPLKSYKSGDAYSTTLIGAGVSTASGSRLGTAAGTGGFAVGVGHYTARQYTQVGSAVQACKAQPLLGATSANNTTALGTVAAAPAYPDPVSGSLNLTPILIQEAAGVIRGELPGALAYFHNALPLNHLDTVAGGGDYAGVSLLAVTVYDLASTARIFMKTNVSWF